MSLCRKHCFVLLALVLLCAYNAVGQQISGSIIGTVKDSQQAAVTNAKVTLTNPALAINRETQTLADGGFVFTQVQPGTYSITIEASGFKKFTQKDIKLFASDRIALGDLVLEVGALSESVTVEAQAAAVQTASAERSGVITQRQVLDSAMLARSIFDLARTLPGIVAGNSTSNLGVGSINANGGRNNQNNYTLDGVTNMDTGSNGGSLTTVNPDTIAEMKVILNSQPAEFGRASGAQIQVVTKGGTRDLHGVGYWFHRHEGLNANSWRNNIDNRPRAFYRYNYQGFNVGGPAFIPGKFNKDRDKLFFFVGIEWQEQLVPQGLRSVTVPTELERQGDFSQTHDSAGFAPNITITDPLNNKAPFPGNKIPTSRLNADGMKILNWYPKPNAVGISPSYNYQTERSNTYPRRENVYRGDYNVNDKWRTYARYIKSADQTNMQYGQWNASYNIPLAPMSFGAPGWSWVANVTTIINPTLTNEFVFGSSRNDLHIRPVDNTWNISNVGVSYKMPYPDADKLKLVQNWQYDVPNAPSTAFNGTPFLNFNHTIDITDSVAKVRNNHTYKTGIYLHRSAKDQTAFTSVNGNINFNRDTSNPGDANWSFANAALGNYRYVQQSSVVLNGQYRSWNIEWFVQDNWRVNNKLTLDYGIRFYWIQPQYDAAYQTSSFNPALYDVSARGVLRMPAIINGVRQAVNPLTGEVGPAAIIGSLVNTGKGYVNGLYANGMGLSNKNGYPAALIDGRGIQYAPRLGIAYQVQPKTVIRAGIGVFYDRLQGNPVFDMLPNPPSTAVPQFWYGNLASIPSAAAGTFFPQNVNGFDKKGEIPTTYNWNFTIQRELPFGILADAAYVGSNSNHLLYRINLNTIPLGQAWLPQNQEPTNSSPKFDGTTSQAANFYRPFMGYGSTTKYGFGANSNYHSLQMSANRRMSKSFTFGIAYTWSKAMGTTNDDYTGNYPFNMRIADYDVLSTDRTHVFVANWVYNTPKVIKGDGVAAKFGGLVVNDWQISGIATLQSGAPGSIGFNVAGWGNLNERFTGSPDIGPRIVYKSNMKYPGGIEQWVDSSVLAMPTVKGSTGFDSSRLPIRNPGLHNYDISIFKLIPLHGENVKLQLRCEMFNAFNHTQFTGFNGTATFNPTTGAITNLPTSLGGGGGRFGFGAMTGTADPRRIQLAAKIYF